jgi:hypothetical protein
LIAAAWHASGMCLRMPQWTTCGESSVHVIRVIHVVSYLHIEFMCVIVCSRVSSK